MYKNKKFQLRLSEELYEYCKSTTDNISLFIRDAIRDKIDKLKNNKNTDSLIEIRAKTPYVFFAKVEKIIDGDTLLLKADLGFFVTTLIKVRLSGIDTEPIKTELGKQAKQFVKEQLKDASLLVETHKRGKYGRYLAYLYYHKEYDRFEELIRHGKVLNDELIKEKLAVEYK